MIETLVWLPILILGAGAVFVYGVARLVSRKNRALASVTVVLYAASLTALLLLDWGAISPSVGTGLDRGATAPVLQAEPGAMLVAATTLILGLMVACYSGRYLALDHRYEDYYPLLLLLSAGVVGMVMAVDLFVLYLFTVLTSATGYVLVAFRRRTSTAVEAGLKYAVMGGMVSVLMLSGVGFLYRDRGSLMLPLGAETVGVWGAVGLGLVMFGYLVKGAIFPAHTWLPDAHGRAPSSVSAMLSGVVVQANLYVLVKTALGAGASPTALGWVLVGLSIPSMTVGNLMALRQTYGKRLLGYSTIAQLGYMMAALGLGLAHSRSELISAGLFLMVVHAAMKGLAFLAKGTFHLYCDASLISDLDGMLGRVPLASLGFLVSLAGLAGIPPLAGFTSKLYVVSSAVGVGGLGTGVCVVVLLANTLLSLGYYLPLIGRVIMRGSGCKSRPTVSPWMQAPVLVLGLLVLVLGVSPGTLIGLTRQAGEFLLAWGAR